MGLDAQPGDKGIDGIEGFDQERAGAAGHIQHARWARGVIAMLLQTTAHGLPDDIFGDEGRGVVNALGLALRALLFNMGNFERRRLLSSAASITTEGQILLVDGAEHIGVQGIEVVAHEVPLMQPFDDFLQNGGRDE